MSADVFNILVNEVVIYEVKKSNQDCIFFFNIDSSNGKQLTIESARETSSLTAQQPGRQAKVLKLA